MDLELTEEQAEIVAAASGVLERLDLGAPLGDADWRRCGELGWFALGVPDALGGVGYGAAEEALLFTELGRRLAPGPFLGTVLAARLAAEGGLGVAAALLAGEVGVAVVEGDGPFRAYERRPGDLGLRLGRDGAELYAADALSGAREVVGIDPLTAIEEVEPCSEPLARWDAGSGVWERALLLTAALLTGIAESAMAQSIEHVSSREQFGQPVGAFQAVRHRCADMAIRAEAARSLTRFASLSVDDGAPDLRFQVLSAVTIAREAALANASANIQNHGAIGFTAEHRAHLYVKRARVLSARFGGRPAQLDCLLAAPSPPVRARFAQLGADVRRANTPWGSS